ncbi:DNA polymerase lambda [Impatiens glandulifera]|uniref:DNA polymerase lambda n=1 Tax=Impatiens glandulifera TaxID=253017 RepID=UPI001FB0EE02|nr:DNA polymerase lambda [Impatiens glandulifera]
MAPKKKLPPTDPDGMFAGMVVFFVDTGVVARRLQIWKQKLEQMGASIEQELSRKVTHVFAMNYDALLQKFGRERFSHFKGHKLDYKWLEDSLSSGQKASEASYTLTQESMDESPVKKSSTETGSDSDCGNHSLNDRTSPNKKIRISPKVNETDKEKGDKDADDTIHEVGISDTYAPPDLNKNICEIFGKLVNIYRALGDDRRSFSYSKAIPVIEKLPFKIESADQVKNLPSIGRSLQDHIQEIVNTGKLSKLNHFETDEKVSTISLFGEVWGIGPATALKLYEKGHRTLDDLKCDDSLTHAQKLGLKYFDDIRTRILRHEAEEMEQLLQKAGEKILPGVMIVCGGSYRRGKASCGDLDIIITHPDGKSHVGFLRKYVMLLKDMNFLREDLVFSIHSEEGTDTGVDTYFGLCTYPGRELRHRIDLKVYPKEIYAFGLIAWTGNDVLNRRLRLLAESKGYKLDDTGLFPVAQSSGGKRSTKGTASLHFQTEKEVFDFLGFPCLDPHERNL